MFAENSVIVTEMRGDGVVPSFTIISSNKCTVCVDCGFYTVVLKDSDDNEHILEGEKTSCGGLWLNGHTYHLAKSKKKLGDFI